MKKFISLLLIASMIMAMIGVCPVSYAEEQAMAVPEYASLDDPALLQQIEDSVYANTELALEDDNYTIEDVSAIFVTKEYLEEMEYYSRENVYYGYTLKELDRRFDNERYYFTLGDNGQTVVKKIAEDSAIDAIIAMAKDVVIGTGIIIVCVVISYFTKGAGTSKTLQIIHAISTEACKKAFEEGLEGSVMGALSALIAKSDGTDDVNEVIQTAMPAAAQGFKHGAIFGTIAGMAKGIFKHLSSEIPSWSDSESKAFEKYNTKNNARAQVSFLDGKEVSQGTDHATRPDIVWFDNDHLEAIEVKNYDCERNMNQLRYNIKREVSDRVVHLPEGSTQKVVLDFRNRGYTQSFGEFVKNTIQDYCMDVYPNLPVEIMWY